MVQGDWPPSSCSVGLLRRFSWSERRRAGQLAKAPVFFEVFTWGDRSFPVTKRRPGLTVETCMDYFYGYVAAKG